MNINIENIQNKTLKYFEKNCRKLETELLKYFYFNGNAEKVITELKKYQNIDGGFGNALESDFRMPYSSPIATTMALQVIEKLGTDFDDENLLQEIMTYLENTFNLNENRWYAASEKINDYPRAVWWNYDEKTGGVQIDKHWGNPTIEIIAYAYKYRRFLKKLNIIKLVENAVEYINNQNIEDAEEHEIYCMLKFYNLIKEKDKSKIEESLKKLVNSKINLNKNEWHSYVPQPLDFIKNSNSFLYTEYKETVHANLEYLLLTIKPDFIWEPTWEWYQFNEDWQEAKKDWTGVLTVNYLRILDEFGYLKK